MKSVEQIAQEAVEAWMKKRGVISIAQYDLGAKAHEIAKMAARLAYQEAEIEDDFADSKPLPPPTQGKNLNSKIEEILLGAKLNDLNPTTRRVILDNIRGAWKGAPTDADGFALEMAETYTGMVYLDDDAEIVGMTTRRLADLMRVLGHRTRAEPHTAPVDVLPGYQSLFMELRGALDQAQKGKGAERHNVSGQLPFDRQRMQQISRMIESPDGMVYQVCKKVVEGVKLPTLERQVAELHGAIVYLAGIAIYLRTKAAEHAADEFHQERDFRKYRAVPKPTASSEGGESW